MKSRLIQKNIYILCKVNQIERTFYFNESKEILVESIGVNEVELENVKFSTTHILGSNRIEEILINRVFRVFDNYKSWGRSNFW